MKKIIDILLYAGLSKENNRSYRDLILRQDSKNLTVYLLISGVLFLCLGLFSAVSSGFARVNTLIYLITALAIGILFLVQIITGAHRGNASNVNRVLIYLFMMVLYVESIALTIMHKDQPAVTYIGVLLMLPLLFAQYPLPMIVFQGCFVVLFCICSSHFKYPEIASIDVWNGISFFFVSAVEIMLIIPMRFSQIIQPELIREVSEKDLLTGLKNRNYFETYCRKLRQEQPDIICIYADANGLHELNNTYGHEAGDNMLKAVANSMMKHFGKDNVYRIGGDEFVAFSLSVDTQLAQQHMLEAKKELDGLGYHVSMGYAATEGSNDEIDAVIKRAEVSMYDDKRRYYGSAERNRRQR